MPRVQFSGQAARRFTGGATELARTRDQDQATGAERGPDPLEQRNRVGVAPAVEERQTDGDVVRPAEISGVDVADPVPHRVVEPGLPDDFAADGNRGRAVDDRCRQQRTALA